MLKGSKGKCESPSHKLLKEKTKTRLEDLQGMLTNVQAAKKESGTDDIVILVEQANQMVREWRAELNEPSPASSLLVRFLIWWPHQFSAFYSVFCIFCVN